MLTGDGRRPIAIGNLSEPMWPTTHKIAYVCTGVKDQLPGVRYPDLTVSLYNMLLFLLSDFYNNSTKILAVNIDIQYSYCNIVFLIIKLK